MIPSAFEYLQEIAGRSGRVAVFLDYDGTLTPIVSQPEDAGLSDSMQQTLRELARQAPDGIPGARVERKHFSIAVHYRNVRENDVPKVERAVGEVAARHCELRRINGKKVYELLPAIDWDKGKAVIWLLETLGLESRSGGIRPIYIGDDSTDEDAFRALDQRGIGILVTEQSQPTAARYSLRDPAEVERFLRALTARLRAAEL